MLNKSDNLGNLYNNKLLFCLYMLYGRLGFTCEKYIKCYQVLFLFLSNYVLSWLIIIRCNKYVAYRKIFLKYKILDPYLDKWMLT